MTNDKAEFTQGSILKKLVAFMMPVLGALILQAMYGAVDLLVVGRLDVYKRQGMALPLEKCDFGNHDSSCYYDISTILQIYLPAGSFLFYI